MAFKMQREDRAKQFQPFAALKGYEEALRKKEKITVDKLELSDDYKEELDRRLQEVRKNDLVSIVYFYSNEYLRITGRITDINKPGKYIVIVNTKISFTDIYDIRTK